jgi:hypothetical protein
MIAVLVLAGCAGSSTLTKNGFTASDNQVKDIVSSIPNYSKQLQSIKGKGRAIVSEPGNTERVTILFSSDRQRSLVTVRNGIGVEGGKMLTDGDTLTVYNKLDKFVRKVPIRGGKLDRINRLASLNILDMINYSIAKNSVQTVLENEQLYQLQLSDGTKIFVDKKSRMIQQVTTPQNSNLPYSKITYDAYASMKGFKLPRRISIFGSEEKSKVALQLTGLELNPKLGALTINLPDGIPIYYK